MRTSFNHQPEAQPPSFPARRTGQPQYPIYRDPTEPGFFDTFLCTVSAISLDSISVKAQPKNNRDTNAMRSGFQLGGSRCPRLKKAIRKIRNRKRTRVSLRTMCLPTGRRKTRASRPAAPSLKRGRRAGVVSDRRRTASVFRRSSPRNRQT